MTLHQNKLAAERVFTESAPIPDDSIRERAYEIYVHRGSKGGHAEGDWLTAEAELRELRKKAASFFLTLSKVL